MDNYSWEEQHGDEHEGSSSLDIVGIQDLQEPTEEEKQNRRDAEEDMEVTKNIDKIARDGDLSPRQINNLKSGVKRCQPSVPLQVKTRSRKESFQRFSQ
ncbi:hypothetical protein R3W88_031322 [Solanum pinnatisectum]|uniref:Uncharacterized protein n=1 Tax=Solanum pinnatisectum TaxID=50273 RepID=A0AAV9LNK8_9SOLN|nr:hypothetical protein R3W88_031322 [Solanum pinnatisectum]